MPEWFLFTPSACFELFFWLLSPAFPQRALNFNNSAAIAQRVHRRVEIGHLRSQATAKSRCRARLIVRKGQLFPVRKPSVASSRDAAARLRDWQQAAFFPLQRCQTISNKPVVDQRNVVEGRLHREKSQHGPLQNPRPLKTW